MDRRRFLVTSVAGALLATPLGTGAQQPGKVYRIGYLRSTRPAPGDPSEEAFREALRERGWVEGQNLSSADIPTVGMSAFHPSPPNWCK